MVSNPSIEIPNYAPGHKHLYSSKQLLFKLFHLAENLVSTRARSTSHCDPIFFLMKMEMALSE